MQKISAGTMRVFVDTWIKLSQKPDLRSVDDLFKLGNDMSNLGEVLGGEDSLELYKAAQTHYGNACNMPRYIDMSYKIWELTDPRFCPSKKV